ncbi:hypothetical protein F3Y22_tig00003725pilonHSYRG00291 [Hibiscus syriacus]|uniref:Reverse transcriptase zinc-binding domain-containing protein n=1 Tax=Hibiscus syriacus TaxID=106335 RepID=A0A6A3CIV8_HIBSY|nr:hypothetical protein F3Y22_tig00003725pilonHSYRG00291 [Hibiscus syriacus]
MTIVEESWQAPVAGNPAQVLFQKLKRLKTCLKELNRARFSDILGQVKQKREELIKIQLANLDSDIARNNINVELKVEKELKVLEEAELLFYKQKAKVNWIRDGDQGTRFFHSMVASKRKSSTIRVLYDQNGTRLYTCDDMSNEMSIPINASWRFKSILKLRHVVSHLFVGKDRDLKMGRIPKHNIIVWMAILDRLPTRVRLLRMELDIENKKCLLCGIEAEIKDHLFFDCGFARELWGAILTLCGVNHTVSNWDRELAWVVHCFKGKFLLVRVFKLAWASHVWKVGLSAELIREMIPSV